MKSKNITIEKGIPFPFKTPRYKKTRTVVNSFYWIMSQMEIGDSIEASFTGIRNTMVQFVQTEKKLLLLRKTEDGRARIWRVL